jgi:HPt (histidine-containing phosphotransfer) domain-containing protein
MEQPVSDWRGSSPPRANPSLTLLSSQWGETKIAVQQDVLGGSRRERFTITTSRPAGLTQGYAPKSMFSTVSAGAGVDRAAGVAPGVLQGISALGGIGARGAIALVPKSACKGAHEPATEPARPEDRLASEAIDRAYLARFTLGNAALEREVLELFADQAPIYVARLREAATPKEWKDAAHTIKGSASAIGAWRLARFAEMAERIDPGAAAAGRDEAVAAVSTASEEVCRHIERLYRAP